MKKKATRLVKEMVQALVSMAKSKSLALSLHSKISALKIRVMFFSLLSSSSSSRVNIRSNSNRLQASNMLGGHRAELKDTPTTTDHDQEHQFDDDGHDQGKSSSSKEGFVLYFCNNIDGPDSYNKSTTTTADATTANILVNPEQLDVAQDQEAEQYHSHQQQPGQKQEDDDGGGDRVDDGGGDDDDDGWGIGKTSAMELMRNSKELEEQIDEVADLFIERFHRQIRMQNQHSFNSTRQQQRP